MMSMDATTAGRIEPHLTRTAPRIVSVRAIPVAGRDSMLLNLSGAPHPVLTLDLLADVMITATEINERLVIVIAMDDAAHPAKQHMMRAALDDVRNVAVE